MIPVGELLSRAKQAIETVRAPAQDIAARTNSNTEFAEVAPRPGRPGRAFFLPKSRNAGAALGE
jgi:hypothetical protein